MNEKSARLIQSFYRHWRWGKAVKEVIDTVGKSENSFMRQSGYNPPYDFHLQYVNGTPSWCCPAKQRRVFEMTKDDIVDYLIRVYLREQGKHPLTYEAIKIQRTWRKHNHNYGNIYTPKHEVNIQNWWRTNKIKRGWYFTMSPKAIGEGMDPVKLQHKKPQLGRTYQYQEGMVFHVKDPKAKCTFIIEQKWKLPKDLSNYIVRIIV